MKIEISLLMKFELSLFVRRCEAYLKKKFLYIQNFRGSYLGFGPIKKNLNYGVLLHLNRLLICISLENSKKLLEG